jgi:ABC-type sugar transport system substrate-binding protein
MRNFKLTIWVLALLALTLVPTLMPTFAQEPGAREMTEAEQTIADAVADCPTDQALTIAASVPGLNFPFFVHMMNQLVAEGEALGVEVIQLDGQNSSTKQTADVEAAVSQGVDAIVISPADVQALADPLQAAVDAGIPVVTIDRFVEGVDGLLAHVGAENVLGGEAQANWILENYPDGASVFHLQGQPGAGPAIARNQGVHNILDEVAEQYPIVFEQTANFARDQGLSVTESGLAGLAEPPDVIVAANDDMALGALEAVQAAGLQDQIAIIGFDALPEALASVADGGLAGTIEQFPGGQSSTAMRIAVLHARGCAEPPEQTIFLTPIMITADNLASAERIGEVEGIEMPATPEPGAREMTEAEQTIADAVADCPTDQALTIAASVPGLNFPFFVHMMNQLVAEGEALGVEVIQLDGQNSSTKQTADVEAAVSQGVDAIVISPADVQALADPLQAAVDAGIPVVTIDRFVEGVDGLLAHVGAENVLGGEAQANWILENYPDGASVFHLQGQPGAGPAIARNQGVHNILDEVAEQYPIVFEQTANFARDQGLSVTESGLAGLAEPPDVIVAANDDMALGALEAVQAAGLQDQIAIIGFDALPEALASVADGGLAGTIEQFPGGQSSTAMRIAVLHARGCAEPPEQTIFLTPIMITADNLASAERIGEVEGMEASS